MRLYSSRNKNDNKSFLIRVNSLFTLLLFTLVLGSCASLARYPGIGRIRRYTISDARLPDKFDGTTIAFITDTHYPSKYTRKRLSNTTHALETLKPDLLLLGGDYVTSLAYADELFAALSNCTAKYGKYAVLGNHDKRNADTLRTIMQRNGIRLLADESDTLRNDNEEIYLCGIKEYNTTAASPVVSRHTADGFTIVLVHVPDYAQDTQLDNAAVVFSGHTHGGQVTLLGLYTPVIHSRYGKRFLSGLNFTDNDIPVITSNGLGTSRKNIRFCAPSDIVFVTLRKESTH